MLEQAANQASGSGNPLVPGVTSQTKARKKRFGGSSLTIWLTMAILVILSATFFLYLLVPIAALLLHAPPSEIWNQMQQPDVIAALKLSFVTTTISTSLGVVFGLPAAIILNIFGIRIAFTTTAVVMAQIFVAAPFFVNTARSGLLPLVSPALLTAVGLSWARALGEFGATITFAGNFPGVTQTLPIAVYIASQTNLDKSIAVSVILLAVSFAVLLTLGLARTWLSKKWS